jgi:putative oxidoreductase
MSDGFCEKYCKKEYFYLVFRVLVGLMFAQHGFQKIFGAFGGVNGQPAQLFTMMGAAGLIELLGGLAVALGLFTRLAASISGIEMLIAYSMAHASKGLLPIVNGGELALLYFAAFVAISAYGAGKYSLEKALMKKEFF